MIKKQFHPIAIICSSVSITLLAMLFVLPSKVENIVLHTLTNSSTNITDKLLVQQQEIASLLTDIKRKDAAINNQLSLINGLVNGVRNEQSLMQVQSGDVSLSTQLFPELMQSSQCNGKKGIVEKTIKFDSPFLSVPHVLASFQTLDFANGPDHRLKARVSNITTSSFVLSFHTWCDTRLSQASLSWLAIGL
ncbi:hypothetical protein CXF85_17705 [Colwellia sp. 75C3]|uniref:H-type lectin domain-containing protein n=1 Tax=Colwellia sp. 75C3 TaxID=888425 RepID=UPI000C322316|nr:H-type lectin domain-containing protein [Colwellia sp. 75C3]PKG81313.1 hypothetical protein CXF85_17705 [Colwellia sp. 75C3]